MSHPDAARGLAWLDAPAEAVARRLLGCEFERTLEGGVVRVRIVEAEAYDEDDEASHAHRGPTPRNASMFGPPGHLYVYMIHGHHCCNVVAGAEGWGQGVLIRAAEPVAGVELARQLRPDRAGHQLMNGPGKLCQALGITRALDGHDLSEPPLRLIPRDPWPDDDIAIGRRIGVTKAVETLRRYWIRSSRWVSRG